MKVIIGGPVRDRGWILQRHLDALKAMRVPEGVEVEFLYLLNDSTDDSEDILERNGIRYAVYDTGHPSKGDRSGYAYDNLARLRNAFLQTARNLGADYILSIDSDIIVPPHALEYLIADDKDIVSMLLCNQPLPIEMVRCHNVMRETGSGFMAHILDFPMDAVFPCDLTGACYLISAAVVDAGCRYAYDQQGEDIPFCRSAKAKGFSIFCDSRILPLHAMHPGEGGTVEAGRLI